MIGASGAGSSGLVVDGFGAQSAGEGLERRLRPAAGRAERDELGTLREHAARPAGIGEEGDRVARADEDGAVDILQQRRCLVDVERDPRQMRGAATARQPGDRGLRNHRCAGARADGVGEFGHAPCDVGRADDERSARAVQRSRSLAEVVLRIAVRDGGRRELRRLVGLRPGDVVGDDQGAHAAVADLAEEPRGGRGDPCGGIDRGDRPADGPGHPLDIGGERRIEGEMIGGVLADDVEHRGTGLARVVKVRHAVGEAGAEVE